MGSEIKKCQVSVARHPLFREHHHHHHHHNRHHHRREPRAALRSPPSDHGRSVPSSVQTCQRITQEPAFTLQWEFTNPRVIIYFLLRCIVNVVVVSDSAARSLNHLLFLVCVFFFFFFQPRWHVHHRIGAKKRVMGGTDYSMCVFLWFGCFSPLVLSFFHLFFQRRQLGLAEYGNCHTLVPGGKKYICISLSKFMYVSVTICVD